MLIKGERYLVILLTQNNLRLLIDLLREKMKRSENKKVVSTRDSQDRRKHKKKPMETKPVFVTEELSSESEEKSLDSDCFKF